MANWAGLVFRFIRPTALSVKPRCPEPSLSRGHEDARRSSPSELLKLTVLLVAFAFSSQPARSCRSIGIDESTLLASNFESNSSLGDLPLPKMIAICATNGAREAVKKKSAKKKIAQKK
jgi:hypothetical protein